MYPELFQFTIGQNNLAVSSYMLFWPIAFGYILFTALLYLTRHYRVPVAKALGLVIFVAFSFFVGARLLYVKIHAGGGESFFSVAAVHPTQAYEILAALLASALAWVVLRKGKQERKNRD